MALVTLAQGLEVIRQGVAQLMCPLYKLTCAVLCHQVIDYKFHMVVPSQYLAYNIQYIF